MEEVNPIDMLEFMDQVDYALSLRFRDKWRHKFSVHFISIFQEKLIKAFESQKPVKKSSIISTYTKKYKYQLEVVEDFFKEIDLSLYYPLVYEERAKKSTK